MSLPEVWTMPTCMWEQERIHSAQNLNGLIISSSSFAVIINLVFEGISCVSENEHMIHSLSPGHTCQVIKGTLFSHNLFLESVSISEICTPLSFFIQMGGIILFYNLFD